MGNLFGYARVSTDDQCVDLQVDALKASGCGIIFTDIGASGAKRMRPGLSRALAALSPGDTLVVWKLDRLGRSLSHLIDLVNDLDKQGIQLKSLQEAIDTRSSGGKLFFHVLAALGEFERSLISERTIAGQAAAKKRGKHLGRLVS